MGRRSNGEPGSASLLSAVAAGTVVMTAVALAAASGDAWFQMVAWALLGAYTVGVHHQQVRPTRWWLIGAGFACFAVGELAGPLVHIAGYPFLVAGLALLVGRNSSRAATSAVIDAGILVVPVAIITWVVVIGPVADAAGLSRVDRATAIAHPVGNLMCLFVVARFFVGLDREGRVGGQPALALLVVATASLLGGDLIAVHDTIDLVTGDLVTGDLVTGAVVTGRNRWSDALALVGFVALGALAWTASVFRLAHPRSRRHVSLSRSRSALLAAAALVTPGILLVEWLRGAELSVPLVLGCTAGSFLLVIARMHQLMSEIDRARRRLHFDTTHDALTGLPNRQLFDMHLDRGLREGRSGGVMFVDLDHFKLVNDTFGHQVGDEVLQEVAGTLRGAIREDDLVARLSGDEFVVLVHTTDENELLTIAHRILERLRITRMTAQGRVAVTASVGLVRWEGAHGARDARQLVRAADDAMYRAKHAEGDQLVVAVG